MTASSILKRMTTGQHHRAHAHRHRRRSTALKGSRSLTALDDLVSEVEIRGSLASPLGSLFSAGSFFAGRGLRLPVKVVTLNMTNADFYSSFTDCGINQSLQKIWITFSVNITFLTPAGMQATDVTSDVILAETVIVGSVPETFLQLN